MIPSTPASLATLLPSHDALPSNATGVADPRSSPAHRPTNTDVQRSGLAEPGFTPFFSVQMQTSLYGEVKQHEAGEILSCCGTFPGANKNLK